MTERKADIDKVLGLLNQARAALGESDLPDLPKGQQDRESCPIAVGLWPYAEGVEDDGAIFFAQASARDEVAKAWGCDDGDERVPLHLPEIQLFVEEFDQDMWPEYLENENE